MISVFVNADRGNAPLIADHYDFVSVPSIGEDIVVEEGRKQYFVTVESVTHYPEGKGDTARPISYVSLKCKLKDELDLDA